MHAIVETGVRVTVTDLVRIGVIGVGGMGSVHARYIQECEIKRAQLTAVCDMDESKLAAFDCVKHFTDSSKLIRSGEVDAVLIATPHYLHTLSGIEALSQGLHVLVEKPVSVHKADCERLIAAKQSDKQVFAAMFNQRTVPAYKKLKQLFDSGELGKLIRINWTITDWFRTEAYYCGGGWRATWKGEGGGVLLNQCPHQIDLLQWIFGMPERLTAFCKFGSRHDIEVEDSVTCYMEFADNADGVFIASTGEAPGTNRLEVACERGELVLEKNKLLWTRTEQLVSDFCKCSPLGFAMPDVWNVEVPVSFEGTMHRGVTQNFVDAILDQTPLIAPAEEGMNSVELANAMIYSSLEHSTVELPLDSGVYEAKLQELIANSTHVKKVIEKPQEDMESSWQGR